MRFGDLLKPAACMLPFAGYMRHKIDRSVEVELPAGWPTLCSVQQIKSFYYKSIMDLDVRVITDLGIWHMTFLNWFSRVEISCWTYTCSVFFSSLSCYANILGGKRAEVFSHQLCYHGRKK